MGRGWTFRPRKRWVRNLPTIVSSICGFSTPAAVYRDLIAKEVLGRETGQAIELDRCFAKARKSSTTSSSSHRPAGHGTRMPPG